MDDAVATCLLVGVDGSDGSRRAVDWAARMARLMGASVTALHVLTYNHELLRDLTPDTMRTWRRELQHDLETTWVKSLRAAAIPVVCKVVEADSPASGLITVAQEVHADLVVVGAQGQGNLSERVLGGVTYRLAHRSKTPVVVVPPSWDTTS